MNLERYWAKPDKTIQQHINDLLTRLETLKTMGYIDSDDLYEFSQKKNNILIQIEKSHIMYCQYIL